MKKVPNYIHAFVQQFQELFGVQMYDRTIGLSAVAKKNNIDCVAEIEIFEDYQRINIIIYPLFFSNTRENQRQYLLHEFCHYLTNDVFEAGDSLRHGQFVSPKQMGAANEKSTSKIANIIEALLLGKCGYARDAYARYLKHGKK